MKAFAQKAWPSKNPFYSRGDHTNLFSLFGGDLLHPSTLEKSLLTEHTSLKLITLIPEGRITGISLHKVSIRKV